MTRIVIILTLSIVAWAMKGQDDPVLVKINGQPVHLSEFRYIYEKNNREQANYSEQSVREYLDLYTNFKLKVHKARDLDYDDQQSYKEELAGYRKQLASSYIIDREVVERLANEIFERKKYDIGLSHILIKSPKNSTEDQRVLAYEKISKIEEFLGRGMKYEELATSMSEDLASAPVGGDIGYITAMLPDGFLDLETEAYKLEPGQVSDIILSDLGYHIIKVKDRRPARGVIKAQHILIRSEKNDIPVADAERRIRELYLKINNGELDFGEAARRFSEDTRTSSKNGDLGFFGIGRYEKAFEDAVFALKSDGEISQPFQSSIGWHIAKRNEKRSEQTIDQLRRMVKERMVNTPRFNRIKAQVIEEIKTEAGFNESAEALSLFIDSLDEQFLSYRWPIPDYPAMTLFTLGGEAYSIMDFAEFAKASSRARLRAQGMDAIKSTVDQIYQSYVDDIAIDYMQARLEDRYPDFRNLMREYEEGILLFEITKDEVWEKASKDTVGLRQYYEQNSERYNWEARAVLSTYTIQSVDKTLVGQIYTEFKTSGPEAIMSKYNRDKELIKVETETWEKNSEIMNGIPMTEGFTSMPKYNNSLKHSIFKKVEKILPAENKSLREARGYIVSDYQDLLEKKWIESLRKEYEIQVNEEALKKMIIN